MEKKKSKILFRIIKWLIMPLSIVAYIFIISSIFTIFKADLYWGNMFEIGQASIGQIALLVLYRLFLYIPLPWIISFIKFDNRYKYISRVVIWYNWMFLILSFVLAIYEISSLNLLIKIKPFNSLSSVVLLLGYVFTFFKKEKVDFTDSEILVDNTDISTK